MHTTINSLKILSFIALLAISTLSFARQAHEYAPDIPVFGPTPKVAVFPLDFNELIAEEEQALIEPRLPEILRDQHYIPEKIVFAAEDLAAYHGVTDATTPDNESYRTLYGGLIKSLALDTDIVLIPSITLRIGSMKGKVATGDGVTFKIPAELRPGERITEDPFNQRRNNSAPTWSGNTTIYSLRLTAFNAQGDWLFTAYGGISFPFYAVFSSGELKPRTQLFTDKQDLTSLNKGIEKAFYPLRKKIKRTKNR